MKNKYHTDPLFRAKFKAYMVNRYWNEPEFRENALARGKAWRDACQEIKTQVIENVTEKTLSKVQKCVFSRKL